MSRIKFLASDISARWGVLPQAFDFLAEELQLATNHHVHRSGMPLINSTIITLTYQILSI